MPASTSGPLHILWRDEHRVAVCKPASWLVHRTGLDACKTRFVLQTLRDQLGPRVYQVHRLDKGTCGVLVMALHRDAARALGLAFERQRTHKRYIALVRGWLPYPATGQPLQLACDWPALQTLVPDAAAWLRLQQQWAWQPVPHQAVGG